MGGTKSQSEAEAVFQEFIQYLKSAGVPAMNAKRAAESMRDKCNDGLQLAEIRENQDLASAETWTTSKLNAERQAEFADGRNNMHLGADGETRKKLMGMGPKLMEKLDWKSGYDAFALFLSNLDGETSVEDAVKSATAEIGGGFQETIGHQIMLEFLNGTYTRSSRLFHSNVLGSLTE